MAGLKRLL